MTRHIVLIHRYFSPDTPPYASLLRELAEHLASRGYQVTVLTCQPSYNRAVVRDALRHEKLGPNVTVVRWGVLDDRRSRLRKGLNLVWFSLRLIASVPSLGRVDAMMAASTPPIAIAAVTAWLARRKNTGFIYHKQDIYPEVTTAPGRANGAVARLLRWTDTRTDRAATRVVVLSQDMSDTTRRRGVPPERIAVINNFDPWHLRGPLGPSAPKSRTEELHVVFAGNLGRFQNLEPLFAATVELREDAVQFHFFGEGPMRAKLADMITREDLHRVHLYGYREPSEVAAFLAERADLGIVSLSPGVIRAAYPSKSMSYLRNGTPVLAMVERDSELAATVRRCGVGCQVEPGDVSGLVKVLRDLAHDRSSLDGARDRARRLYVDVFDRDRRLQEWDALFDEATA